MRYSHIGKTGVIVGRFQVAQLTSGHKYLFECVADQHTRLLVVLGDARTPPNASNPLDFSIRQMMIYDYLVKELGVDNFNIVRLPDERYHNVWTKKLDQLIEEHEGEAAVLYCGRDGFKPCYDGKYDVVEIDAHDADSGSKEREKIAKNPPNENHWFRAGVIYAHKTRHFQTYYTVDGALLHDTGSQIDILLGRKPNEELWRLPGGFIEEHLNEPFTVSVAREVQEETGVTSESGWQILQDYPMPKEWRIARQENVSHRTILLVGWFMSGRPQAGDDLEEVKWFSLKEVLNNVECVMEDHRKFFTHEYFRNQLKKYDENYSSN
jgi:bifunctional NMN adenylyltransferase/nudix hydrolase